MKLRIGTLEAPGAAVAGPICETLTVVRFVEVASANVVCAVKPEVCPVAVRVKVTPASLGCTTKLSFVKLPFLSATEVSVLSGSVVGSSCRTIFTVSPRFQPAPVMTTVCPGA